MPEQPKHWTRAQLDAARDLLLIWGRLSPGDISVIQAALARQGSFAATVEGCAHCDFWERLVCLGWAARTDPAPNLPEMEPKPAFFVLTPMGRKLLPDFMRHYDLREGRTYKPPPPKPALYEKVLDQAALAYLAGQDYRRFTRDAAFRLRRAEAALVGLAIAGYAEDIRLTAAKLLELEAAGAAEAETLYRHRVGLIIRIDQNMAFDNGSLKPPHVSMRAVGADLDIGLGPELDAWLRTGTLPVALLEAWQADHAAEIERFAAYALDWSRRAGEIAPSPAVSAPAR
jgi:hypothetical protein